MKIYKNYISFGEENILWRKNGVAVIYPAESCGLDCIFCSLNKENPGYDMTSGELAEWILETHADSVEWCGTPHPEEAYKVVTAVRKYMNKPFILKTAGIDSPEYLKNGIDEFFDIYLPDIKFADKSTAERLCGDADYPVKCHTALTEISEMNSETIYENRILKKGVLCRHLQLPGELQNTLDVLSGYKKYFFNSNWILNIMSEYTPPGYRKNRQPLPENLCSLLIGSEHQKALDYAKLLKIKLL